MLFAAVAAAVAVAYLAIVPPTEFTFYPKCQLHSLTGLHCPGCGTTRAVHAGLNGRFAQSLAYNALAWVAVPVAAIVLVRSLRDWYRNVPTKPTRAGSPVWPWVIGATLLLYAILRNLPWHPFTLLAPHEL